MQVPGSALATRPVLRRGDLTACINTFLTRLCQVLMGSSVSLSGSRFEFGFPPSPGSTRNTEPVTFNRGARESRGAAKSFEGCPEVWGDK